MCVCVCVCARVYLHEEVDHDPRGDAEGVEHAALLEDVVGDAREGDALGHLRPVGHHVD